VRFGLGAVSGALCVGFALSDQRNSLIAAGPLAVSYPIYVLSRRMRTLA
jgi:hypothetical protein